MAGQFPEWPAGFTGICRIETYLYNLSKVTTRLGYKTYIYQCATIPFEIINDNCKVIGIKTPNVIINQNGNLKTIYNHVMKDFDIKNDILLFGGDQWSLKNDKYKIISIQHGIAWDKPIEFMTKKFYLISGFGEHIKRFILRYNGLKSFRKSKYKVCVDYNFLNWYRTYYNSDKNIKVIVNSVDTVKLNDVNIKINYWKKNNKIRILFARRFEPFRGTKLVADAIEIINNTNKNIYFTLAGDGSDAVYLKNRFQDNPNVTFTIFNTEKSLDINYNHDIALIPSFGSEGTSFSVAEAMGAATAVIATDSGGITNMILNNYNGILIRPDVNELLQAILYLAEKIEERERIVRNAYNVAISSFSLDNWEMKWINFINEIERA